MMRTLTSRACQQIAAVFLWFKLLYCYFNAALYVQSQAQCECVCMLLYQRIQIPIVWSCSNVFPYVQASMLQLNRIKCTWGHICLSVLLSSDFLLQRCLIITAQSVPFVNHFVSLGWEIYSILLFINFHWDIMMIWSYRVVPNPAVWIKDLKQIVIKTVVCLM